VLCVHKWLKLQAKASCPNTLIKTAKPNSNHGKGSEGVCKHSIQQKGVTNQSAESMGTEWTVHTSHKPQASSLSMTIFDNIVHNSIMYICLINFSLPQVKNKSYYCGKICVYSRARCSCKQYNHIYVVSETRQYFSQCLFTLVLSYPWVAETGKFSLYLVSG
jgi:hypothetical protein